MKSQAQSPRSKAGRRSILASLCLLASALWLPSSAQTVITAPGLAAFGTNASAGGGGGGCSPSYSNTGGQGNRTSVITLTEGGGIIAGTLTRLIDGTYADGTTFWQNNITLDGVNFWVQFDFGSGHTATITEATYKQSTANTEGTWQWQGSNNATSWTNIGSTFTLGGSTSQVITALSGNTTAYRYYRLLGISGTTSFTPWIRGIDFKLCYT